jgi:hypothetical protein
MLLLQAFLSLIATQENLEMKEMEKVIPEAEKILEAWKPTPIHFGEGAVLRVGEVVKKYGDRTLLVIGKNSIRKSGVLDRVLQSLAKNSVSCKMVGGG